MEYNSNIKRMDVMLVDPDLVSRGNLGALVRDFGCYLVRPFEDVDKAVVSIVSKPPSVVICNWDPDGRIAKALLEQTRRHHNDKIASTPIIIMSRKMTRQTMAKFLLEGATQVLACPVVPSDLMKKLVFVLKDNRIMTRSAGRLAYATPPNKKVEKPKPAIDVVEFESKPLKPEPTQPASAYEEPDDILEL